MNGFSRLFDKIKVQHWAFLAVPLVLTLFLLPALLPLLRTASLPCTHDNSLHYYRITAMRDALRHGWLFSRWVPNLALGYGYPFFNFREPLPYLAGEFLAVLGLPLPLVLGLMYAASLVAAAWGAYLAGRDLFGERAGWIAAVSYGMGPYLLLDVMRRGNLTESVALALLPWLLFTFRRLVVAGGRWNFVAATALLAALFLSHNISSLIFAPFLGGYVLILAWFHRQRRAWPWAFAAVLLAVLFTAWFWLPALAEQDTVQLHLSRTTRNNDFHYNFAGWREMLFTWSPAYDPDYLNAPMTLPLGVLNGALAAVGLLIGLWRARGAERRTILLFFALAAFAYLWMATPGSVGVWEKFSMLAFVQFPWRLVGRALLPVALLGGALFASEELGVRRQEARGRKQEAADQRIGGSADQRVSEKVDQRIGGLANRASSFELRASSFQHHVSRFTFYAILGLLTLVSYPHTYPPKGVCELKPYPGMRDVYGFELAGWMGVDPESSYFPIWVEQHPADMRVAEAWLRGEEPARFDAGALPDGGRVLEADYHPLRATVTVETPEDFRARWLGLYYPGWQVWVDGEPAVQIAPEEDTGLLTFMVPAGTHTIQVRFGETPLHRAANLVSGLTLLAGVVALMWKRGSTDSTDSTEKTEEIRSNPFNPLRILGGLALGLQVLISRKRSTDSTEKTEEIRSNPFNPLRILLGLSLGLLLVKVILIDHVPNPLRQSRLAAGELPEVATAAQQPFDGGISLIGTTLTTASLPADGELRVDLLWQARAIPPTEFRTVVLLVGADGQTWSTAGTLRPRGYEPPPPTTQWLPGQYAYDPHIVTPLAGTPPGEYRVVAALFDKATLAPASVLGPDGNPQGTDFTLGTVRLLRPSVTPELRALDVPEDGSHLRCGPVGLLAMTVDRASAAPGDVLTVRWAWEATLAEGLLAPKTPVTATLALFDAAGAVRRTWDFPPVAAWWPTNFWAGGERWVGRHSLYLPVGLESGVYTFKTLIPGCESLGEATLDVVAPERVWTVPPELTPADVTFGGRIRLAGYALEPAQLTPGESLLVRLVWQGVAEMTDSYRVFVHLIGPGEAVVAQSDGVPAAWSRPTTGWAVGEVVTETREVAVPADLPPGKYRLQVGLYLPNDGRPKMETGEDAWVIENWRLGD